MIARRHIHILALIIILGLFIPSANATPPIPSPAISSCLISTPPHAIGKATTPPPLNLGLDAYSQVDKLSYLELGDRVEGQSTADPLGTNNDKSHVLYTTSDGGNVLFDQTGPGLVSFMRMQETYGGPWNLSLDASAPVTIRPQDLGSMHTANPSPITPPYPLSLDTRESQGSSILAGALPFQKKIQLTSTHPNGNFYALYRKLPFGTQLPPLHNASQLTAVIRMLREAGGTIAPRSTSCQQGSATTVSGGPTSIATLQGPSQIRALTFQVPFNEKVRFGNSRLEIYWDGETTPSVNAPVKFLVGDGAGVYQPSHRPLVGGWLAGANGDGQTYMNYHLYWPMPFASQARIVLVSDSALSHISWQVRYEPFQVPANWYGIFHATYRDISHPTPGQDMTLLDVQGSGKLVGTVINFHKPDGTLEGDPRIYLDDSTTPQIAVTGTEEWGLGGNYWNHGVQTTLPLGGMPSSISNPSGTDVDGSALYRFLVSDSIPFNRHLVARWEHGGNDQSTYPYRSTMLWYGNAAQTATLSDTLQVVSSISRQHHHYSAHGEKLYTVTAANEYSVKSTTRTSTSSMITNSASFTMALDPHNVGAYLRRTFDYCQPNQRANIYIYNQFAGTWYNAGGITHQDAAGHLRCWRDEDFPLPPSLTQGKSSVNVRVVYLPTTAPANSGWTASDYQMYSFVMPTN
ncbi:hypothetical protein KDH_02000 [Dictyobacter sp. S3.2.2.5]|uniref:DUF2961 domain-containing protein n=1 Tax=Dictyobacter halimunensis TaxID=3026934 RepID=A0ABQ6FH60_9CHLR|nr:hypothetical protein KDH_02000 [Dictyobacter sp. S3.2.2.5]